MHEVEPNLNSFIEPCLLYIDCVDLPVVAIVYISTPINTTFKKPRYRHICSLAWSILKNSSKKC